jgi:hypothetical protein
MTLEKPWGFFSLHGAANWFQIPESLPKTVGLYPEALAGTELYTPALGRGQGLSDYLLVVL